MSTENRIVNIYLIRGYKGHGKSTYADFLVRQNKQENIAIAFADPLKEEVYKRLNIKNSISEYNKFKDTIVFNGKTFRQCMIETAGQKPSGHYANILWSKILLFDSSIKNVIVHDWRFQIEYKTLNSNIEKGSDPFNPTGNTSEIKYNIITCHIINKRGAVPPLSDETEHDLDSFKTDVTINVLSDGSYDITFND